jgi:hypothetical protein
MPHPITHSPSAPNIHKAPPCSELNVYFGLLVRDLQNTALFHTLINREVTTPRVALSSVAKQALLAHHAHIRLRLPGWRLHHMAPRGHRAIFYLIRPLNRGTLMGTSHGIFLYRRCAFAIRRATLLLYKGLPIYIIYVQSSKGSY